MTDDGATVAFRSDSEAAQLEPTCADSVDGFEDSSTVAQRCESDMRELLGLIRLWAAEPKSLVWFAPQLLNLLYALARRLYVLYLTYAEENHSVQLSRHEVRDGKRYERRRRQSREIGTLFGKVRYWRTYMHCEETKSGYYPLDAQLGLTRDGFTLRVISMVTRLATRMSYDAAVATFAEFCGWAPATRTVEELVLGLGKRARAYIEQAAPPASDGDVLVIQIIFYRSLTV